nr:unnamed protein product [Trichobilharzia regenti]
MLNSSVLNKNKVEDEYLSMPKIKYSNTLQFDTGNNNNNKHKVEFFDETDEYPEYGDESIVEQESKTVWLERIESISQKFHDNNNYWSSKLENIDRMKNSGRDIVQNTERQTNSSRTVSGNTDRKIKPTRLHDSSSGVGNSSGRVKLTKLEPMDYHGKFGDKFAKPSSASKLTSIPVKQMSTYRASRIK